MISIIICSRKKDIEDRLKENIKLTVGVDYELIIIDNSDNKYSIFEAYNIGVKKSNGSYLCFMHDDILFHTQGWGNTFQDIFKKNKQIGLIGVAGTRVKSKFPSAWWRCPEKEKRTRIIQHSKYEKVQDIELGFKDNILEEVVVIDGVFMIAKRIENFSFDESIGNFHNYDLNLCFEYIKRGFKVYVTNQVLVEHFSAGTLNYEWLKSTFKIHDLYTDFLPLKLGEKTINSNLEVSNAKRFIKDSIRHKDVKMAIKVWKQLFVFKPFLKFHLKFILILFNRF